MSKRTSRRDFMKATAAAGFGYFALAGLTPTISRAANEKLRIAGIGVGGKGHGDITQAANHGDVVAICDIDDNNNGKAADDLGKKGHKPKKFVDYRKMFEEMGKTIDAVTVSTPDHTHAPASLMAMNMGKHVYCQKPLTHDVAEARQMRETAQKMKVCTQMGNQGTAEDGLRRAVEIIQAGVLGAIREVHVWTNRPIWPQAPTVTKRPEGKFDVPKNVHWDEFLGTAPERPYAPGYHPFAWRGWWDFGTGALGDMACHTANMAFMALKLEYPTSIVAQAGDLNPETYPSWAEVTYQFPSRGTMPPIKFVWHEGKRDGKKVLPPEELTKGLKLSDSGSMLIGDKGMLFSPNDYGASYQLIAKDSSADSKDLEAEAKKVDKTLPRNGKGDDGMKEEWVRAIRSGKPETALSNFAYAGLLAETVLLGNVAIRAGTKLDWDGPNLKVTNSKDADKYLKREYRKGWTL